MSVENETGNLKQFVSGQSSRSEGLNGAASMGPLNDKKPGRDGHPLDQGTDQPEASKILKKIRDLAFDSSDEKLALALGRGAEEVEQWMRGQGAIDADVLMKARGLAQERGLELE